MSNNRTIEVTPPGGGDWGFLFERMTGWEGLGRPFWYDVDLLSKRGDIDKLKMLGEPLTVSMAIDEQTLRHFNGVIVRFAQVGWTGDLFRYRAHVRPWLWLLTRTANSRIFQPKSVVASGGKMTSVDIITKVFADHKVGPANSALLDKKYDGYDYVVQYQETDFHFVSRLMEREGIYYYFDHDKDIHKMILADSTLAHAPVAGYETIPYFPPDMDSADRRERDHIDTWSVEMEVEPGAYATTDYDFQRPTANMVKTATNKGGQKQFNDFEIFEYPGRHIVADDQRERYAGRRLEEQQVDGEQIQGAGNARGIQPGYTFKLTGYPAESEERSFLVTAATYTLVSNEHSSGAGIAESDYQVSFRAIDLKRPFRPAVTTPRPTVQGPQTAVVVGEPGAEISTDEYGRVKVQFPWDREGQKDQNSSMWIRVSQYWAGTKWGAMHIPRVGQEVIVDFLEGDPDQPIITGRVYNEDRMPPYKLTDMKTQSGWKSHSTPGGGPNNFNELRFEDKKGSEEVFMQAERNQTVKVKADRSVSVGGNETIDVKHNRTTTITEDDTLTIHKKHTMTVDLLTTQTFKNGHNLTVNAAKQDITVDMDKFEHVQQMYKLTTDAKFWLIQGGTNFKFEGGNVDLKSAGTISIESPSQLELKVGGSSITLTTSGIEIKGAEVKAVGGASVHLTPGGADIKGLTIKMNG